MRHQPLEPWKLDLVREHYPAGDLAILAAKLGVTMSRVRNIAQLIGVRRDGPKTMRACPGCGLQTCGSLCQQCSRAATREAYRQQRVEAGAELTAVDALLTDPDRLARIATYTERASQRLPLFAEAS